MARKSKKADQNSPGKTSEAGFPMIPPVEAISTAAYFRAEARGFTPGHELEDWLQAEQEVASRQMVA